MASCAASSNIVELEAGLGGQFSARVGEDASASCRWPASAPVRRAKLTASPRIVPRSTPALSAACIEMQSPKITIIGSTDRFVRLRCGTSSSSNVAGDRALRRRKDAHVASLCLGLRRKRQRDFVNVALFRANAPPCRRNGRARSVSNLARRRARQRDTRGTAVPFAWTNDEFVRSFR